MATIEERVLAMKFDGNQFLAEINKSLIALDKLNKGLKLQEGTKGLQNIGSAAGQQVGALKNIESGVQSVADRFKTMGIVGMTAISNVTNQAIFAGQQMIRSLTVDPILKGFREYELNMNSIQTILANTQAAGTKLSDVTATLDELNHYSDQTIYNFAEMAKNIGTFTAAGVGLKPAASAIKGIANLAALSGSNSQQASAAMYQLSQAISSGRVTLEDWNSVVNAGMGGTVFQRALAQTAEKMGTLSKGAVTLKGDMKNVSIEGKSFRESITAKPGQESWLTSDVLTKTLAQFTGDLKDAELAAMGFDKAQIKSIQNQAKMAKAAATEVKTFTQLVSTLGESAGSGWSQTWKTIFGDFEEAKGLFTNANNVLGGWVSASADARNKVLADWDKLGGRKAIIDGIALAFNNVMEVVTPIKKAFRDIFPPVTGKQLADLSKNFRDFMSSMRLGEGTMDNIRRTARGFFAVLDIGWMIVKQVVKTLFDLIGVATEGSGGFLEFTGNVGDWLVKVRDAIKNGEGLRKVFEGIGKFLSLPIKLIKVFIGFIGSLINKTANLDIFQNLSPLEKLGSLLSMAWGSVLDVITGVWNKMGSFRTWVSGFFSELGVDISKMFGGVDLSDVFAGLNTGIFATIALMLRNLIGGGGVGGIIENLSEGFENLTGALGAMQNTLRAATLLQIAAAILILAVAMDKLSKIDQEGLTRSGTAITVLFADLMGAMFIFEKFSSFTGFAKMPFVAASMILLATAVNILASAVEKLSLLDWNSLAKGLTGTTVLLGSLVAVSQLMGNPGKMISTGLGMLILAAGVKVLVSAVTDLSGLSWGDLIKGLVGVAGILGALTLFTRFADANKGGVLQGAGLILLAAAIKILASAVEDMSGLSWGEIGRGLTTIAGALAIVTAALMLIPPTAPLAAAGVLIVAFSLSRVADALQQLGGMSWGEIGKGLTAMLGSLAIITAALTIIPPTAPLGAASILIVALSLGMIGNALERFSQFSWEEIGKAMVVLAGSLGIIAIAMMLMTSSLPGAAALLVVAASLAILTPVLTTLGAMSWEEILKGLVALAGALTIIGLAGLLLTPVIPSLLGLGAAILLLGAGLALAGAGVFLFATGLAALAAAGGAAAAVLVGIVLGLASLLPVIAQQLGVALITFSTVIAQGAPKLGEALYQLLSMMLDVIMRIAPKLISTLEKILGLLLEALVRFIPKLVDAGVRLVIGIYNGIAKNVGKLAEGATKLIQAFMNAIATNIPKLADSGAKMVIKLVNGIAEAIRSNAKAMGEAGANLATAIIEGMARGLAGGIGVIASKAREVARSALNAAKGVLGINSPSKEFEKVGRFVNDGFRKGLDGNKAQVYAAFNDLKKMLADLRKSSSKDVDDLEAKLKKLKRSGASKKTIAKTKKDLAQAKKEEKASKLAYDELTKRLNDENSALGKLADKYDQVTAKLDAAKKTLEDAKKTRDDYNKSVTDQYGDIATPTGETKLADYVADLKKQVEDTKSFANTIQQLRKLGLNDESYKDLLAAGPDSLPFLKELLAGGKSGIDEINKLNKDLDSVASSLGQSASNSLYQAAVDSAAGLVKGLQQQQAAIEKQMDKIADAMVKAIKKKLGIKSPSRVFAEIGEFSAEGLVKGFDDNAKDVGKGAGRMADTAMVALRKSLSNTDKMILGGVDIQPSIRPVLDLTDIRRDAGKIGNLLPSAKMSVSSGYYRALGVSASMRNNQDASNSSVEDNRPNVSYTQNNYSPKPLSSVEIYRQTKNQLSTVKGALDKNDR